MFVDDESLLFVLDSTYSTSCSSGITLNEQRGLNLKIITFTAVWFVHDIRIFNNYIPLAKLDVCEVTMQPFFLGDGREWLAKLIVSM